jgi:hypothetical protein
MPKELEIIKKAMADNKKVFLKEMKQINDKIDNLSQYFKPKKKKVKNGKNKTLKPRKTRTGRSH